MQNKNKLSRVECVYQNVVENEKLLEKVAAKCSISSCVQNVLPCHAVWREDDATENRFSEMKLILAFYFQLSSIAWQSRCLTSRIIERLFEIW